MKSEYRLHISNENFACKLRCSIIVKCVPDFLRISWKNILKYFRLFLIDYIWDNPLYVCFIYITI